MKYAPGRPVYCPLARQQHRHRKSPGGEVTAQSINLPPRPSISPRHLPTTLTHRHTHPRTVSLQTPATLYPNRGGSDELPQKSYGCFGPRDFRPCPSVFMFLLFPFPSLSKLSANSRAIKLPRASTTFTSFEKVYICPAVPAIYF